MVDHEASGWSTSAGVPPVGGDRGSARSTGEFGVIAFLASDLMLFAPFFAAYFVLRSNNDPWPAAGVDLDVPRALAATVVLVMSSFTLMAADRAGARAPGSTAVARWLLVSIALGAAFLANQISEYSTLEFHADAHPYGSIYWVLTGLHAAHVTAGLGALGALLVRSARTRVHTGGVPWAGGVSLFWHLVDVVWVAVFLTIWVIR